MRGIVSAPTLFGLSIFVALLINVYPMPGFWAWLRPQALCLVMIYWFLYRPQRLGLAAGWLIGLLQDVVTGGVWGANAFALVFVAYICQVSYQRLRSYSVTQQTFWVFVFVGVYQIFGNWFQSLVGYSLPTRYLLVSTFISAACWPLLVLLLQRLRPLSV